MSIGRTGIKLRGTDQNIPRDKMLEWFKQEGTTCESLACWSENVPAYDYHVTRVSFVFLCKACKIGVLTMHPDVRKNWERDLGVNMYSQLMKRSYVVANVNSGFALEEAIEERENLLDELAKIKQKEEAAQRRELRKAIRESSTKIGAPDEELITARQRQEIRRLSGLPILGGERVDKAAVLQAKLIPPVTLLAITSKETE